MPRQPSIAGTAHAPVDCGDGVRLLRDVEMRLSDGTVLVSDHYLPPGDEPAPALVVRQPYGKDIATTVAYAHPVWFARHGYVVVVQDVRGRGGSGGDFYPFVHEEQDGHEAIDWVSRRPECNGKVGMYGFSYQGVTQLLAATRRHPALRCIAPWMTVGDLHGGWFYQNGLLRLASTVGWATQMLRGDAHRMGLVEEARALDAAWAQPAQHLHAAPYAQIAHLVAPALLRYYADWISNESPGPYWQAQDLSDQWDALDVPALHLAGWHDLYLHGSIDLFERMSRASTASSKHQHLVAGPWVHIPWGRYSGEADHGPEAMLDTDALLLGNFVDRIDAFQKAVMAGIMAPNEARVRLGLMPLEGLDDPKPLMPGAGSGVDESEPASDKANEVDGDSNEIGRAHV